MGVIISRYSIAPLSSLRIDRTDIIKRVRSNMDRGYQPLSPSEHTFPLPPPSPNGFQRSATKFTTDQIAKGAKLESKAQKKITGCSIFGFDYDAAARLYAEAAECYKLSKSWEKAGGVYLKQAGCHLELKGEGGHGAASAYVDAGQCYEKISVTDAISCFDRAVNLYMEIGCFKLAVIYCQKIGKLYEVEHSIEKAIIYYERAAELFQSEEIITFTDDCNQCKQKVAQFSAQLEQYPRAIAIYEDFAKQSLNKSKSSVTGYLLSAGLCQLCLADAVALFNALEHYEELDPTFPGTHEYKFLADLAASVAEEDVQKFTDVVEKFRSLRKQDSLKTTLLMRIEEKLKAKEMEKMVQHSDEK